MGNCASKFKVAAVAIRASKNEAPKNQFNTGREEYLEHWKMVSDDIGIEEPKMVRLANPNPSIPRLNFDGLEHLLPEGMMKASILQKSGVANAMENFLMEEKKNVNQNLERLKNRTSDPEVIRILEKLKNKPSDNEVITNLGNPQKPVLSTMSKEEFQSKLKNWMSGTEVIQTIDNSLKVSSTMSTQERLDLVKTMASNMPPWIPSMDESRTVGIEGASGPVGPNRTGGPSRLNEGCMDQLTETNGSNMFSTQERLDQIKTMASNMSTQERLDQIKTMASNMSMDEIRAVGDQIKTMASNMSMDEIKAVGTEGAGRPGGPNRTGGPSRLNEGCMDQLTETMASKMSMDENMGVDTGGARGPPVGAEGTGVWCNGVWFPTFGEPIEDLDDFINPSIDENQESNGPMETFLKNGASGSEVDSEVSFNPRKFSSTLPTQNLNGMDQITETMSIGPKTIKKTKNVAMAGILRQAAKRSPGADVENRADGVGGTGGAVGAKGTRIIQDLNLQKVSSTFSIQERLDQIKTMSSNMSMDENRAVGNEGAGGPVGPNRTKGSSGILRQAATRSPSDIVENKALGPGGAGGANGAKRIPVIFVPHHIKTMSSNMSMDENRAVGTEGAGGPVGPKGPGGSSGILRQAETRSPSASVENKALGPGAASAAEFAKRVKATPDFGLHSRLRDGE